MRSKIQMVYTVSDFMTRDVVTVSPDDSLRTAVQAMQSHACRRLPVLDQGRLVGIISDRDVRLALASPLVLRERWYDEALLDTIPVRACMSAEVLTVSSDSLLIEAARLMRDHKIGGLPVKHNHQLAGIITETDVLNALIQLLSAWPEPGGSRDRGEPMARSVCDDCPCDDA